MVSLIILLNWTFARIPCMENRISFDFILSDKYCVAEILFDRHLWMWIGKNTSLWHISMFGCEVYDYVSNVKWSMFNKKEMEFIFVDY